jgi:hypothetical protein
MVLGLPLRLVIYSIVWGVWLLRKYTGFDLGALIATSTSTMPALYYLGVAILVTVVMEWVALVKGVRLRALQTRGIATAGTVTNVGWIPRYQPQSLIAAAQSWRITASYVVDKVTYTTARRFYASKAPAMHATVTVIYDRNKPKRAWLRLAAAPKVP